MHGPQLSETHRDELSTLAGHLARLARENPDLVLACLWLVQSSPRLSAALKAYQPKARQIAALRARLGPAGQDLLAFQPGPNFQTRWDCAARAGLVQHSN